MTASAFSTEAKRGQSLKAPADSHLAPRTIERLAAIVESSDDAIIAKTLDGTITDWNKAAERIFGYTAEEAIGCSVSILVPSDHLAEEADILNRVARGERVQYYQTPRLTKDGRTIQVMLTVSPIYDQDGKIVGASKIARDVTEIQAAHDLLAHQTEALRQSNEELERYAYITSHDLQEPLRTVASFAGLLRQRYSDKLQGDGLEYLKFITSGVERMQSLIRDLLSYSRIDSRGNRFAAVDCHVILQQVMEDLKAAIDSATATIIIDPLPMVHGDATQLGLLFQNLLTNAIKFRGDHPPRIQVSAADVHDRWVFSVRDNGIGIDPQYFDRIFIVFQRLHTLEEYGGTGIGLAVCKKIVERHKGRIWVESTPGQGATFYFSIPKEGQSS